VKNVVSENDMSLNYNKWVKGIADREFGSQKLMLNDLFNKQKEQDQSINLVRHQNSLPFPLDQLVPTLGNAIISLENSLNIIKTLKNNPLVKSESSNTAFIEDALKNLEEAAKFIQNAAKCVDNIKSSI
jgi:hypothetical protein